MQLQRTDSWLQARLGKVGASRIADLMSRTRTGYGSSRATLMAELICERLTGVPTNGYTNAAMVSGIDTEPQARAAYEFMTGRAVEEIGFVDHPSIAMTGASPDGLISANGLLEIKCPTVATHIETLLSEAVAGKYVLQMQWQMACTDRDWCDFVSFDPRLPAEMQMWMKRIHREQVVIDEIEGEVRTFLDELDAKIDQLRSRFMQEAA